MEFQFFHSLIQSLHINTLQRNYENYALIVTDLRMTGLNAIELLKKVDINPKVRTILMSAYNFEEDELYQKYMKEPVIKLNNLIHMFIC